MSALASQYVFAKYHALGNDFVFVDTMLGAWPRSDRVDWSFAAVRLCDRHRGIGADGLLHISADATGDSDCVMKIFNADGSDGGMCGNGIRCVAKHLIERHGLQRDVVRVRVGEGVREVRCEVVDGTMRAARVTMGAPVWDAARVPCTLGEAGRAVLEVAVPVLGGDASHTWWFACGGTPPGPRMSCVSMGNPHAVIVVGDVRGSLEVARLGAAIERLACFPQRVNVQFAEIVSRHEVRVRTWERGAGVTLACGSGACAVVAVGLRLGLLDERVEVELAGGRLVIERERGVGGEMQMSGPASFVANGTFSAEVLAPHLLA
jgi:diaminopimelate epimerase